MNRPHAFSTFFLGFTGVLLAVLLTSVASAGVLDGLGEPDPTDQSNSMMLWLRADQGFAPALWSDQSTRGYDATQAVAASQPSLDATGLGGAAVVLFDGDDFMAVGGSPTGQQTAFFVYKDTSTQPYTTNIKHR